ncbi:MAG TPA: hypothetical protein ENN99_03140 [Chloroflexi bacterium]|nr:hypothetical protein [Chloroflexota bacterium]
MRHILSTWWPLAVSWLFMALEGPMMSAVVARLAEPRIHLAAWSGIVWPLCLLIESPIIMLLSASTALSRDWDSYRKLRRFMMAAGAILTGLHLAVACTPLYYVVAIQLIGAPAEIIEPARWGLILMTPWTWSIAYRRFNQGAMIRFGHSRAVGIGTVIRLSADGLVLAAGYLIGAIPGIVVASGAIAVGVVSEAVYAGLRVRPVLREQLKPAPPVAQPLTLQNFVEFYTPLALTSLLNMLLQPMVSAALSRMPEALDSLAVWSVLNGFVFLLRSLSYALNEVVIALLDEPRAAENLRRLTVTLSVLTSAVMLMTAATPPGALWFGQISALSPQLTRMAQLGLWILLPIPGLNAFQSWYQGAIVHSRHTRIITEAIAIFLLTNGVVLWAGAVRGETAGLYVGSAAFSVGMLTQTAWLWWRSRPALRTLQSRDAHAGC